MEEEKKEHDLKMKKMELEMEQVFEMKVKILNYNQFSIIIEEFKFALICILA